MRHLLRPNDQPIIRRVLPQLLPVRPGLLPAEPAAEPAKPVCASRQKLHSCTPFPTARVLWRDDRSAVGTGAAPAKVCPCPCPCVARACNCLTAYVRVVWYLARHANHRRGCLLDWIKVRNKPRCPLCKTFITKRYRPRLCYLLLPALPLPSLLGCPPPYASVHALLAWPCRNKNKPNPDAATLLSNERPLYSPICGETVLKETVLSKKRLNVCLTDARFCVW